MKFTPTGAPTPFRSSWHGAGTGWPVLNITGIDSVPHTRQYVSFLQADLFFSALNKDLERALGVNEKLKNWVTGVGDND